MINDLLVYGENICAFLIHLEALPHICMTLHPIPSEFPYIWGKFCFLFYQCSFFEFVIQSKKTVLLLETNIKIKLLNCFFVCNTTAPSCLQLVLLCKLFAQNYTHSKHYFQNLKFKLVALGRRRLESPLLLLYRSQCKTNWW